MIASRIPSLSRRQMEILEWARGHREVTVDALAQHYAVTPQTIRRDLNHLCRRRLLQRTHGGAVTNDGVSNMAYAARALLAAEEKALIGERAAGLIPNDSSVFINIGTTTEQVAQYLANHVGMLVITNNINVVNILRPSLHIQLITAGGTVRREDGGIVGPETVDFIGQFKVDYAVIGVSAIEEDGTLLDFDAREVRAAKAMLANARAKILVGDSGKFERSAPVRIGNVSQLDHFVTDWLPPHAFLERCRQHDVNVETALAPPKEISPHVVAAEV